MGMRSARLSKWGSATTFAFYAAPAMLFGLAFGAPASAQSTIAAPTKNAIERARPEPAAIAAEAAWPDAWFEIFRLAPGKHEEFVRFVAQGDEILAAGDLPPTQLFFHESGENFDVILFKPGRPDPTPEQEAAMAKKGKELGVPTGPAYFVYLRELVATHSDSHAVGPISAGQWLGRLDDLRAKNSGRNSKAH